MISSIVVRIVVKKVFRNKMIFTQVGRIGDGFVKI